MKMIAAVDSCWGIGSKGKLLADIPEDLKYFREKTLNKTVIMGRKTLLTFPEKKPLKERNNILLTRDINFFVEGAVIYHNIEEILENIYMSCKKTDDIFIIGGGNIYEQFLPLCDTAFITKIFKKFDADTFIKNLDDDTDWINIYKSNMHKQSDDLEFQFNTYKRIK